MESFKSGASRRQNMSGYTPRNQDATRTRAASKSKEEVITDTDAPDTIVVKRTPQMASVVPGDIWRLPKGVKWRPQTFVPESEKLNEKFIAPETQNKSLARFIKNPKQAMIYGIAGNPDDSKAKYFAAHLVQVHLAALGASANVVWATLYSGYENQYMRDDLAAPTLIVISNLTPNSTNVKLEKARDIIEKYPDVPRLVVCAGIDPLSFLAAFLHVPIHGLAYFSEALVKQKVSVI